MKRLISIAVMVMASIASAQSSKEPELSPATKLEIEKLLDEFLSRKTITQSQHDQSLAFLNGRHCDQVDRSLEKTDQSDFSASVSKTPNFENANVTESFKYQSWHILFAQLPNSEPAYLFYSGSPRTTEPVTVWGGANGLPEGPDLVQWVTAHALGIPKSLAQCFSWHVTFNMGQW